MHTVFHRLIGMTGKGKIESVNWGNQRGKYENVECCVAFCLFLCVKMNGKPALESGMVEACSIRTKALFLPIFHSISLHPGVAGRGRRKRAKGLKVHGGTRGRKCDGMERKMSSFWKSGALCHMCKTYNNMPRLVNRLDTMPNGEVEEIFMNWFWMHLLHSLRSVKGFRLIPYRSGRGSCSTIQLHVCACVRVSQVQSE